MSFSGLWVDLCADRISACTTASLAGSKNICSVRQRPMPSAPKPTAAAASTGASAFDHTPSVRKSSAQLSRVNISSSRAAGGLTVLIESANISPVEPSILIYSPALTTRFPARTQPSSTFTSIPSAPVTHGLPKPRATTAAWLVAPPLLVNTPEDTAMPWTSSALVSVRTKMISVSCRLISTAVSASRTSLPVAAPGAAPNPMLISRPELEESSLSFSSKVGSKSWYICSGSTLNRASSRVISPSLARSTAVLIAALALRFPERV